MITGFTIKQIDGFPPFVEFTEDMLYSDDTPPFRLNKESLLTRIRNLEADARDVSVERTALAELESHLMQR